MSKKPKVVLLEKYNPEGTNAAIVSEDKVELGQIAAPKDGQPLNGRELLHVRGDGQSLEVLDRISFDEDTGGGPAMVNSQVYRDNYEQIFGEKDLLN